MDGGVADTWADQVYRLAEVAERKESLSVAQRTGWSLSLFACKQTKQASKIALYC